MIEVQLTLQDAQEVGWFAQFSGIIEKYRAGATAQPSAPPVPTPDAQVIAVIVPAAEPEGEPTVVIPMAPEVTQEAVEAAAGAYLKKKDVAGALEILNGFGVKQISKLEPKHRAAAKQAFEDATPKDEATT